MLLRRRQLAAKLEGVEGTAETLDNTNAKFLVVEPKIAVDIPVFKRDPSRATLSNMAGIPGMRSAKITFKLELRGSGVKGTAPAWGLLLRACGMAEDAQVGTSVTYLPASAGIISLTMALFQDGLKTTIKGARGTVKLVHKVGEPVFMEFEFTGVLHEIIDAALLESIAYETPEPPVYENAQLSFGGDELVLSSLELDIANEIILREDANAAAGLISAYIVRREPKGTADPEMELVADHDFFGKLQAGTLMDFTETIGSVAGNKFVITDPKVQYEGISDDDRGGIAVAGVSFGLTMDVGDDELSIQQL